MLSQSRNTPSFFIIGAQKAATTFLHRCLIDHPDIYMPHNEISYFEDPDYHTEPFDKFLKQFEQVSANKIIGIKRPSYLYSKLTADRIKDRLQDVKILIVIRNPIERLISACFHYMRFGFLPVDDINKIIPQLLDEVLKIAWPRSPEIIAYSKYFKQIDYYFNLFKRKNCLVLKQDDIRVNKIKELNRVYDFLGIDNSHKSVYLKTNPKASIYSIPRLKFLVKGNRYEFTYFHDSKRLTNKYKNLSDKINIKIISGIDKIFYSKIYKNEKPKLSSANLRMLKSKFLNDIHQTSKLIDISLEDWK